MIEAPPQQRISQKIFKEQVKKDELAVLKEKYSEVTFLLKVRIEIKRHLSKSLVFIQDLMIKNLYRYL